MPQPRSPDRQRRAPGSAALRAATRRELAAVLAGLGRDDIDMLIFDARAQDALAEMRRTSDELQSSVGQPAFARLHKAFDAASKRRQTAYDAYRREADRHFAAAKLSRLQTTKETTP